MNRLLWAGRGSVTVHTQAWHRPIAGDAVANTSTIVAMGRFACHVRTVGTMNPIQSPQLPAKSELYPIIPSAALGETNLLPSVCLFETRLESHPLHRDPIHLDMTRRVR